ncbi:transporter [Streptomyces griseocarneus]|nr:transporter [Streptomyces griseocarneus]
MATAGGPGSEKRHRVQNPACAVFSTRRGAGWVLALLSLVVCAALAALGVSTPLSPENWTPSAAESQRADAFLTAHFAAGEPHLVLLATASGSVDARPAARVGRELADDLAADPRVAWAQSYWPRRLPALRTADRHRALVLVRFRGGERAARFASDDVIARHTGWLGPLHVSAAGRAAVLSESDRLSEHGLHLAEALAAPLILVILLWVFASAVTALLPVLVGAFAVVTTTAFLELLARAVPLSALAFNITTALGFGLAVDYSLLLVSRYREEVAAGSAPGPAVAVMLRTAGYAVGVSAATVVAALCALLLFPLPLLRSLACGGIAVVVASAAGALGILPALLVFFGSYVDRWDVFARLRRRTDAARPPGARGESEGAWSRLAGWTTGRPVMVALGALTFLFTLAAPSLQVRFGMYGEATLPDSSQVAQTSHVLRDSFGMGETGPSVVLPGLRAGDSARDLDGYARRLSLVPGVRRVDTATGSYGQGRREPLPEDRTGAFTTGRGAWLSVIPYTPEPLTPEGSRIVERLRRVPAPVPSLVGGPAAQLADTKRVLTERLPFVAGFATCATFLLLLLYTRSVLVPVKALLLNALSLAATFGILVAVFQEGWLPGESSAGITDVLVPLMFAVAFGLSMDYEVFLLSRILEEHRRGTPTPLAVATGLQHTGRLFTSAAVVFAVVMASLTLSGLLHLRVVGVGLAVAVLLDATVVRGLLVPAVMQLAGRANWWFPGSRA